MVIAIVLLGVAAGVEYDLLAYLVSRYFGVRSYARIYGALYALFCGAGFGPAPLAGVQQYRVLRPNTLLLHVGFHRLSLALLLLGRYRDSLRPWSDRKMKPEPALKRIDASDMPETLPRHGRPR